MFTLPVLKKTEVAGGTNVHCTISGHVFEMEAAAVSIVKKTKQKKSLN